MSLYCGNYWKSLRFIDRVAPWGSKFEVKKGWDGNEMLQLIYIKSNDCLTQGTIGSMYIVK